MEEQAHLLTKSVHIIPETHPRDQRDACEKPERRSSEMEQQVEQCRHPPDDAPTTYGDVVVRAPFIRFVYDVEPVRYPEINKNFGNVNGAAIIYPYIREHLTSLSVKAGVGIILLPPANFAAYNK